MKRNKYYLLPIEGLRLLTSVGIYLIIAYDLELTQDLELTYTTLNVWNFGSYTVKPIYNQRESTKWSLLKATCAA